MRVLLLRNYRFDGSVSMRVFANMLARELSASGAIVQEIAPKPMFGCIRPSATGVGKWLGYIDRFVVFPTALRRAADGVDVVHICDHGNAMYTGILRDTPVVVTCHDMLAVRGALGEVDDLRPSFLGHLLQKWIVSGLRRATRVACVSQFTFDDAVRVLGGAENVRTVMNGLPYPFTVIQESEAKDRLSRIEGLREPFILHVGSGHRRKNREAVLRVFAKARSHVDMQLVLAGEEPSSGILRMAEELGVSNSILYLQRPETSVIEALYNRAVSLLFPSRYEGFGWPPIEAQACGCPAVTSNIAPFAEILGSSAELFPLEDEDGMARAIVRLATDRAYREQMRQRGFENVRSRFQAARMAEDYLKLYNEVRSEKAHGKLCVRWNASGGE